MCNFNTRDHSFFFQEKSWGGCWNFFISNNFHLIPSPLQNSIFLNPPPPSRLIKNPISPPYSKRMVSYKCIPNYNEKVQGSRLTFKLTSPVACIGLILLPKTNFSFTCGGKHILPFVACRMGRLRKVYHFFHF